MAWTDGATNRALAQLVIAAYGWVCWLCGEPIDPAIPRTQPGGLSLDHVKPRSKGGTDSVRNLRPAHLRCNLRRGPRAPKAVRRSTIHPLLAGLGFSHPKAPAPPPPAGDSLSNHPEKTQETPQ